MATSRRSLRPLKMYVKGCEHTNTGKPNMRRLAAFLSLKEPIEPNTIKDKIEAVLSLINTTIGCSCSITFGRKGLQLAMIDADGMLLSISMVSPSDPRREVILASLGEDGSAPLMEITQMASAKDLRQQHNAAKAITLLANKFLRDCGGQRGLWHASGTLFDQESINKAAEAVLAQELPNTLWVKPSFFRGRSSAANDVAIGGYTTGLLPFVGREFELEPFVGDAQQIMLRLTGLVKWVLLDGLFMADGDTLGNEAERIRLTLDERGARTGTPIVRMQIEALGVMGN